ncbi:hypothetical protein T10_6045 [Trichinella papuae]|uniref:PiggyBac transposable element-derived protein domain-containing protein n=1 Tax=Trichinella papuae TaxID=268474 RepID=A0A0V1MJ10_9BILA|nr:hypothetical protein T10_6045 [Trichinella papuae]
MDNSFTSIPLVEDLLGEKTTILTLVSYILKQKKCVLLLSTMHHDDAVREDQEESWILCYFVMERSPGPSCTGVHMQATHPMMANALKVLLPFTTSYMCEIGFSAILE